MLPVQIMAIRYGVLATALRSVGIILTRAG